ncbi:MAG: hypothetical protein HZC03_01660 [Candidatus Lloydbacteria bacterium]|nr:hypothetical protein [Candidatus Lloydbacteria bacterium]
MGDVVLRVHHLIPLILLTEATEVLMVANHLRARILISMGSRNHLRTDTADTDVMHPALTEEALIPADLNQEEDQEENIFIPIRLSIKRRCMLPWANTNRNIRLPILD